MTELIGADLRKAKMMIRSWRDELTASKPSGGYVNEVSSCNNSYNMPLKKSFISNKPTALAKP